MSLLRKIPFLYRRAKYRGEGKQGGKGGKVARFAAKPEPSRRLARYREGSRQPAAHRSAMGSSSSPGCIVASIWRAARARRPFGRRGARAIMSAVKPCRWPQRPQRNAFAARSATAQLTTARCPHLVQRIGQRWGIGSSMRQDIDRRGAGVTRAFDLYQAKLSFPYASTSTREIEHGLAHTFQTAITGARIVSQPLYRPKLPGRLGGIVSLVCPCQV